MKSKLRRMIDHEEENFYTRINYNVWQCAGIYSSCGYSG